VVHRITMPTHLMLDMAGGALLAASPWLFGFSDYVTTPHVVVGLFEIVTAAVTERRSGVVSHGHTPERRMAAR
jgi:hypothetical protein